jgi:uncharacterized protein (DUF2236 family)
VANLMVKGAGDEGLFGPGSITWRIHSDPAMLIGGLRALLIQALDPLTMAGVAQHSDYKTDSWNRLLGTTHFVMATTYGDTAAAHAAVKKVKAIHDRVKGIDDHSGLPYSANDPDLLLWVHAVEVDSFLTGYRRYGGRVTQDEADRYVEEMSTVGGLMGIPSSDLPRSVAQLEHYLETHGLEMTEKARDAMRFILYPPVPLPGGRIPQVPAARLLLIPGRAVWSTYAAATIAILPRDVRRLYRLPWIPHTPALRAAVYGLTRTMRRSVPPPQVVRDAMDRRAELEDAVA